MRKNGKKEHMRFLKDISQEVEDFKSSNKKHGSKQKGGKKDDFFEGRDGGFIKSRVDSGSANTYYRARTEDFKMGANHASLRHTILQEHKPIHHVICGLKLTIHARERQLARGISDKAIEDAIRHGTPVRSSQSTSYTTDFITVVAGQDGVIITLINNTDKLKNDITTRVNEVKKNLLIKIANNNDSAMCDLAELYLSGDLGKINVKKATSLLLRAAKLNSSHAMCLLAKLHQEGKLSKPNPQQALVWWEMAAQRKNKYALYVMAQTLLRKYIESVDDMIDGKSKESVQQQIKEYIDVAVDIGGGAATWLKALIIEEGYFGERNPKLAVEYYIEAVKTGHTPAIKALQRLLLNKTISEELMEKVLDAASEVIGLTDSEDAVKIGLQQINGLLGNNRQRGFRMLEKAAVKNNIQAILTLAKCYRDEFDFELSERWFHRAEALLIESGANGNVNSLWKLGRLYLSGNLGKVKLEQAEKLFIKAVNIAGDPSEMVIIGRFYIHGYLGNRSPLMGHEWIAKARKLWTAKAKKCDVEAIQSLINLYLDKELGFKDYNLALHWLEFLAVKTERQDWFREGRLLGDLYSNEKRAFFDLVKAKYWYEEAANLNNSIAQYRLGVMYCDGKLGKVDLAEAIVYFDKAAKNGCVEAIARLVNFAKTERNLDALSKEMVAYWLTNTVVEPNANSHLIESSHEELAFTMAPPKDGIDDNNVDDKPQELLSLSLEKREIYFSKGIALKDTSPLLAANNFRASAKYGNCHAYFELAELFANGKLGKKVCPVAILFYKRAAKLGDAAAMEKLKVCYSQGILTDINQDKVQKWNNRLINL